MAFLKSRPLAITKLGLSSTSLLLLLQLRSLLMIRLNLYGLLYDITCLISPMISARIIYAKVFYSFVGILYRITLSLKVKHCYQVTNLKVCFPCSNNGEVSSERRKKNKVTIEKLGVREREWERGRVSCLKANAVEQKKQTCLIFKSGRKHVMIKRPSRGWKCGKFSKRKRKNEQKRDVQINAKC